MAMANFASRKERRRARLPARPFFMQRRDGQRFYMNPYCGVPEDFSAAIRQEGCKKHVKEW